MGLVMRPNSSISSTSSGPVALAAVTSHKKRSSKISFTRTSSSSRKRWTLFILKQNVSCEQKLQSQSDTHNTIAAAAVAAAGVDAPLMPLRNNNNNHSCGPTAAGGGGGGGDVGGSEKQTIASGTDSAAGDVSRRKERLRGLAAIVQDVLSRSLSDLRGRDIINGSSKVRAVEDTRSEISSGCVSFRMQPLEMCDTGLGSTCLRSPSSSSLLPSEADASFQNSQRMTLETTTKIEALTEGGKSTTNGIPRSIRADEYETVVERLSDPRATIRLLAATAVREATRNSAQAREDLWKAGAIPPLVNLLQERDQSVCYMATVALLNLAIGSIRNKQAMADCGAIPVMVRLMRPDSSTQIRESATTVILSLAASDQLKPGIGTSGAIVYLSDILSSGTTQGRNDAVRALLNLSIFKGNRPPMVQAGVVPPLYKVILKDVRETAEKAVILVSHLFTCKEGRETISVDEVTISVLLQVLKRSSFSQSCKEKTVVMLLALSSKIAVRREAVIAQGILPSLVEIVLLGSSPKMQEKAAKLLRIIKEHRTDEGILTIDRSCDLDEKVPLERQFSTSSTVDTTSSTYTIPTFTGPVVHYTTDSLGTSSRDGKHAKFSRFFRSLVPRSMRSDYSSYREAPIGESPSVPFKILRSFCYHD